MFNVFRAAVRSVEPNLNDSEINLIWRAAIIMRENKVFSCFSSSFSGNLKREIFRATKIHGFAEYSIEFLATKGIEAVDEYVTEQMRRI